MSVLQFLKDLAAAGFGWHAAQHAGMGVTPAAVAAAAKATSNDLFSPTDPNCAYSQYLTTSGTLTNGNLYNVTGFIPVSPGDQIVCAGPVANDQRCFYDANKAFVSQIKYGGAGAFTVPNTANIAYMRLTVPLANWETLKVENLSAQTIYTPYAGRPFRDELYGYLLRQIKSRLANLSFGVSQQLVINLAGDSYLHNAARSTTFIANWLVSKFGDAGGGWCGFGYLASGNVAPWTTGNQPSYLNGNARPALYATRLYGSPDNAYYSAGSADMASITLKASTDSVQQDIPATPAVSAIVLHWIGTGAGTLQYGFAAQGSNPASWTTLDVSGTAGTTATTTLSLTNMVQSGTLFIKWASGTCQLCGVDIQSAASGVRINKLAATGSNNGSWSTVMQTTGYATSWGALNAHAFIYMDGPNSQGGINYQTWAGNIATIMSRVATLSPGADRLLMIPPENARNSNIYAIAGYEALARNLAVALRFALKVIRFGDAGNTAAYASTGSVPLLDSDNLHPSTGAGGPLLAAEVLSMIVPPYV